jgi:hypothetical protein
MISAVFGVLRAALEALNADLDPEHLAALDPKDLAETWLASSEVCREADALYATLRLALTNGFIAASHDQIGQVVIDRDVS